MAPVKSPPGRTYGGQSGDQRRAERRQALVGAAFDLVAERGWRELNIEAVCRPLGLNKRYFYESFSSVDELMAAVTTTVAEDAIAVTLAAMDRERRPDDAVRSAITAFIEHLTDDPRRARVLFGAVPASDAAAGHRETAIRRLIGTVAGRGRSMHELTLDPFVEVAAAMLVGGTSQAVLDWLGGAVDCPREELIDQLVTLWQAVGDVAAARGRGSARHWTIVSSTTSSC